jgi:hypothetical protein
MGAIESKKDGVIRRYEIKLDFQAQVRSELMELTNCTSLSTQGLSRTSNRPTMRTAGRETVPSSISSPSTK